MAIHWYSTEDIIDAGRAARDAGHGIETNPHKPANAHDAREGDKMIAWMLGWDQRDRWIRENVDDLSLH